MMTVQKMRNAYTLVFLNSMSVSVKKVYLEIRNIIAYNLQEVVVEVHALKMQNVFTMINTRRTIVPVNLVTKEMVFQNV